MKTKLLITVSIFILLFSLSSMIMAGGEIKIGVSTEPWDLDPAIYSDVGSGYIIQNVYDPLIELSTDLEPTIEYALARGWEIKDDAQTFILYIKKGVKFHNGTELTAEDIKYNFEWILNPDNNSPQQTRVGPIDKINIIDDYTLEIKMKESFPEALIWWARSMSGIVPKNSRGVLSEEKGVGGLKGTALSRHPVGTGPFKFSEWVSGSHITLSKNEDYWVEGVPIMDKAVFEFISDSASKVAALMAGSVDIVDNIPQRQFQQLDRMPGIVVKSCPGLLSEILYLNMGAPPFGVSAEDSDNEEAIKKAYYIRKAIYHGINREEIINEIFYGMAHVQKGPWFLDNDWTSPELKDLDLYNPELAKEYLAKAGYPDGGLKFKIIATNAQWFIDLSLLIQDQLSDIGIEVEVTPLDKAALFDIIYETDDWNAAMEDYSLTTPTVLSAMNNLFYQNNHNHNNWHHSSPDLQSNYHVGVPEHKEFVALFDKASIEVDEQKRKEMAWELEELVTENVIEIDLAFVDNIDAWRDNIKGYQIMPLSEINLRYISDM